MREKSLMRYIEARKHGRGWEGAAPKFEARRGVRRGCPRVGAASKLFFFFFPRIHVDLASIYAESGRIDHIGSYWPTIEMAKTGQNRH